MMVWKRIQRWYQGSLHAEDFGGGFIVHTTRTRSARAAHVVARFVAKHWQWIIGTAIALVALFAVK